MSTDQQHQPYYPSAVPAPAKSDRSGMATAGMVLGILAAIFAFIPLIGVIAFVLAPLAIVFGVLGRKSAKRGQAIAGMVLGIVGLVISMIWLAVFSAAVSDLDKELNKSTGPSGSTISEKANSSVPSSAYWADGDWAMLSEPTVKKGTFGNVEVTGMVSYYGDDARGGDTCLDVVLSKGNLQVMDGSGCVNNVAPGNSVKIEFFTADDFASGPYNAVIKKTFAF